MLSFVLGLLCLVVGTDVAKQLLDGVQPGLGQLIGSLVGVWNHYAALGRGVVELYDVLFFVAWAVVFLHLNTLFIGLRRDPRAIPVLGAGTALGLLCGLLVGRLTSDASLARLDLTEDKLYTLSQGTVSILRRAEVPIRAKLYISPRDEMPTHFRTLEQDIVDRLEEMKVASGGMLDYAVVHMRAANVVATAEEIDAEEQAAEDEREGKPVTLGGDEEKAAKDKSIERRLAEKGVTPFAEQTVEATQVSTKLVYATLGIAYREKDEEYLSPIKPQRLPELEYLVSNVVAKLVRSRPPKIAVFAGKEAIDPQLAMMYQQMGRPLPESPYRSVEQLLRQQKYDVVRTEFSAHEPVPEDFDALLVLGPVSFDERQKWELARALSSGKGVLVAAQRYTWEYRPSSQGFRPVRNDAELGIDEVLEAQGLGVSRDVLMDENHVQLLVRTGGVQDLFGGAPLGLPMHVEVKSDTMSKDSVLTQRLSSLIYLWGTAVTVNEGKLGAVGLRRTVLFTSSDRSWQVPGDRPPERPLVEDDLKPAKNKLERVPLALFVEGQFANPYEGRPRPPWKMKLEMGPDGRPRPAPADLPETPITPQPGRMVLLGCAHLWAEGMLTQGGDPVFLLNCVDALTLDEDLLQVRSRQPINRTFTKPSAGQARLWRGLALVGVPLAFVGMGLAISVGRMRRRERWNAGHGR